MQLHSLESIMSQRATKCTVCEQAGHTRIHCLVMCDLKAQFDELEDSCQEREEQLAQAQQDADEMADLVRQNEQCIAAYTEQLKER